MPLLRIQDDPSQVKLIVVFTAIFTLASCAPMQVPTEVDDLDTPTETMVVAVGGEDQLITTDIPRESTLNDTNANTIAEQTSVPACSEATGRIERVEYSSQILGEFIPVLVYLPPCYPENGDYPVIFLLHGKPQNENHWLILGIDEVMDQRIASGELEQLILVMPEQPEPLFTQTDGGPGSYEGEFLSALLPFIEQRYEVDRRSDARAIAGISRGGVWALEIAFANPEMFRAVGALSPALNVNDARAEYDPIRLADAREELPERIFLASGDVDSAKADTQRLQEILSRRGTEHRYTTVPGGHEGATWKQLIEELLAYLSEGW
jgi:enterochelin esterase-like enzyme